MGTKRTQFVMVLDSLDNIGCDGSSLLVVCLRHSSTWRPMMHWSRNGVDVGIIKQTLKHIKFLWVRGEFGIMFIIPSPMNESQIEYNDAIDVDEDIDRDVELWTYLLNNSTSLSLILYDFDKKILCSNTKYYVNYF